MRQTQFKRVMILSAERTKYTYTDNQARTNNLRACLEDLGITPHACVGVYKNGLEKSFMVLPKSREEFDTILDLAFKSFEQESVLYRGTNGNSSLYTNTGAKISLGTLDEVPMVIARQCENYTVFNDKYYITKR